MPHLDTPQSRCRFGIARCDITPPVGIYHRMWGAATHERATGVHRPLSATAVVLEPLDGARISGDAGQVVLALDHCLLFARELYELRDVVAAETGIARERLTFVFSHTHAAGLMDLRRSALPGGELIAPYLDRLAALVATIVRAAQDNARPATIVYGQGRCDLAAQRDMYDEVTRQYVCGFNPEGAADDTVVVARVTDEASRTIATFVNYACHPTTLAWENTLISPDFPDAMREVVEQATGAPCVFLQGASGDLGPRDGQQGDAAVADRNGRQLGYAALAALEALPSAGTRFEYAGPVVSGATLGSWKHVPLEPAQLAAKAAWRLDRRTVRLAYRPGLPKVPELQAERAAWLTKKAAAERDADASRARDCHAMIERVDRQLTRLELLPPGDTFPLAVALWRTGDAFWLAVEGEHYQMLQCDLRSRFPGVPILVMTIANGSRCTYLPPAETYGKGIYQESIALLAPGSLEKLIEVLGDEIAKWLAAG